MEQIRIVKEMRENDRRNGNTDVDIRPRYMVWENVPGAFSSNKGEDFRIVLEELAKVKDPNAVIPMPEKWATSGCIVGDGWSIAWRVLDAQFWGVPQRRRRIALVADFGGESAPEILFVRKSVSGNIKPSEQKRKGTASDAEGSLGADDSNGKCIGFNWQAAAGAGLCADENKVHSLSCTRTQAVAVGVDVYNARGSLGADQYNAVVLGDTVSTLGVNCGMSHGRQCVLEPCGVDFFNQALTGEVSKTLNSVATDSDHIPSVVYSVENHPNDSRVGINEDGKVQALTQRMGTGGGNVPMVLALDRASFNQGKNAQFDFEISDKGVNSPIVAKGPGAVAYCIGNGQAHDAQKPDKELCKTLNCMVDPMKVCIVGTRYIVRRLTPLECERLQGYPDGWTDIGEYIDSNGKKRQTSDAARYKALGNSIALPPWKWVLKRLCACYERDATMASLFDGIGGFPYLWEQLNGKGSCLWASEIEEFPMAVTKVRIGGHT